MVRSAVLLGIAGGIAGLAAAVWQLADAGFAEPFWWQALVLAVPLLAVAGALLVPLRAGVALALFIVSTLATLGTLEPSFAPATPFTLQNLLIAAGFTLTAAAGIVTATITSGYEKGKPVRRHSGLVRVTHWINALAIFILLMSGLQIFNAHPGLYWGDISDFDNPLVRMFAVRGEGGALEGRTWLFGNIYDTNGFLGVSGGVQRGFPAWMTLPTYQDLATGRLWHFLFAWILVINGIVYVAWLVFGRHIRTLWPNGDQWRGFFRTVWDHARLRFPHGEEALRYNILQKLSYLGVLLAVIVIVITGLAMSPALNAAAPWLPELFGGRQSARTVHFVCAAVIALFIVVHVVLVLISGVRNNLRSMVTGRYLIREEPHAAAAQQPPAA